MNFLHFDTVPEGLLVTLIGIMIVFLGLIVLIVLISLINRLTSNIGKKKPAEAAQPAVTRPAVAPPPQAKDESAVNEDELIAVIAAAIAMMGQSGSGFVVRRVRRISNAPTWQKAGREEQVYSRY